MRNKYIYEWGITLLVVFENGNGDGDGDGQEDEEEEEDEVWRCVSSGFVDGGLYGVAIAIAVAVGLCCPAVRWSFSRRLVRCWDLGLDWLIGWLVD